MVQDEAELQSPVQKTMRLMSPSTSKTNSVKQQMVVAISQDTPETYANVKSVLDLIKVQESVPMITWLFLVI